MTRPSKRLLDCRSKVYTVYLGAEPDLTWQILEHSKAKSDEFEQSQVITGNQLITIKHTELEAFLCANACFSDGLIQPYFRKYEGSLSEEQTTVVLGK